MKSAKSVLAAAALFVLACCGTDPLKRLESTPGVLAVVGRYYATSEDLEAQLRLSRAEQVQDDALRSRVWDLLVQDLLVLNASAEDPEPPEPMSLGVYADPQKRTARVGEVLQAQVYDKVRVTDAEVEQYYRGHVQDYRRGPGVLLREMQIGDAHKAFEAYQKLRRGQPFADVAREYAGSPEVRARYFQYDELPEYLQPVVAKTRAGSVTPPVEATPELYQILIVVEKADEYVLPLKAVQDEVRLQLSDDKGRQLLETYLKGLGERYRVTVFWAKLPFTYREEAK